MKLLKLNFYRSIVSGRLCGRGVLWQDQGERRRSDSPPEEEKQESTNDSHKVKFYQTFNESY